MTRENDLGVTSELEKNSQKLENGTTKNDLGVDCISREATVKRLCNLAEYMNEHKENSGAPYIMAALFIQDNKTEFPSVTPQEPRWIPVGKKVPVAFEKVLVTYRLHYDDSIHIGIGNTTSNVNGRYYWNINEQDYIGWDILAWMPLPPCYEPQESEG